MPKVNAEVEHTGDVDQSVSEVKLSKAQEDEIRDKDELLTEEEKAQEKEIELGYRIVHSKVTQKVYRIYPPSPEVEDEATKWRARRYVTLLQDDTVLPLKQLSPLLDTKGIWTKKDDKELDKLREDYFKQELLLKSKSHKNSKKEQAAFQSFKQALFAKQMEKYAAESNSLERLAEKEMLYARLAFCVRDDDDNPIWKDPQQVKEEHNTQLFNELSEAAQYYWAGVSMDFLENWLEVGSGSLDIV